MKKFLLIIFAAALATTAADSLSGSFETLDVKMWLAKPGVKLVAVEFYSTWCKPCMEAVPKWENLRRKYRDKGLRLIVVSVRDAAGCAVPAWSPDANVCDEEGQIQELWKADPLPKAFLFSWQGAVLVKQGKFEDVQKAVEQYFAETPRILVEEPADETGAKLKNSSEIKKAVRSELKRSSKFDLVADDKERGEIANLRKKFANPNFDEAVGCKLGKEVSANSQLKITLKKNAKDGKAQLRLELFSMEQGCLLAASRAPAPNLKDLDQPIAEAVADLVQSLIGEFDPKKAQKNAKEDGGQPAEKSVSSTVGCAKDSDCKGDRICEDGKCVSPAPQTKQTNDAPQTNQTVQTTQTAKIEPKIEKKAALNVNIEWASLPAGTFMMGCSKLCGNYDKPSHKVEVKAFKIMKYEATQDQYYKVMGENPSKFKECGLNCPVEQVNWFKASEFCKKIGGRLPSEAEWEYAAKAGTNTKYYCGDDDACNDSISWHELNSGGKTHPVGQKKPNAFGLFDMLGNVTEWAQECWHKDYTGAPSTSAVWEGGDCVNRMLRGGGWNSYRTVWSRGGYPPDDGVAWDVGVRCVADVQYEAP